jgi:hypothetical protein
VTVTAVVLSYWPKRVGNVSLIVKGLYEGTMTPDKTLVVLQGHNAMTHLHETDDWWFDGRVEVIRTPANFHTRAKFVLALLELADWYLLMDDDTGVGPDTVRYLVDYEKGPMTREGFIDDWVTGYWGVTCTAQGSFMSGTIHQPGHLQAPLKVDGFHGRAIFCNHASLARMFGHEPYLRSDETGNLVFPHEGDDIIIGLDGNGWLVPMRGDECFTDLPEHGQALQYNTEAAEGEEHYFAMRDRFTKHVLERLGR